MTDVDDKNEVMRGERWVQVVVVVTTVYWRCTRHPPCWAERTTTTTTTTTDTLWMNERTIWLQPILGPVPPKAGGKKGRRDCSWRRDRECMDWDRIDASKYRSYISASNTLPRSIYKVVICNCWQMYVWRTWRQLGIEEGVVYGEDRRRFVCVCVGSLD